jgi:CcmD family protein
MKIKYIFYIILFLIFNYLSASENNINTDKDISALVLAAVISLLIWLAVAFYIFYLNKKVKSLEKKIDEK